MNNIATKKIQGQNVLENHKLKWSLIQPPCCTKAFHFAYRSCSAVTAVYVFSLLLPAFKIL